MPSGPADADMALHASMQPISSPSGAFIAKKNHTTAGKRLCGEKSRETEKSTRNFSGIIIARTPETGQVLIFSASLQKITAVSVLTRVAASAGPATAAGFTLPYWLR